MPALSRSVILLKFTLILKTKNLTKMSVLNEVIFTSEQAKKLNGETDKFAYLMAKKYKKSLSEIVVAARKEEDERNSHFYSP